MLLYLFHPGYMHGFGHPHEPLQPYIKYQAQDFLTQGQWSKVHCGSVLKPMDGGLKLYCGCQNRKFATVVPKVQRNPSFSKLNSDDISYFKEILGEKNVIQDEDWLEAANTDWMRKYKGSSKLLLQPRRTEEVLFPTSFYLFLNRASNFSLQT